MDFYLSPHWMLLVFQSSATTYEEVHILSIYNDADLVAVIPLITTKRNHKYVKLRYLNILGNVYSAKRGILVHPDHQHDVIPYINNFLIRENAFNVDAIEFNGVDEDDALMSKFFSLSSEHWSVLEKNIDFDNMHLSISSDFNGKDYFESLKKKVRQNIRTGFNRLNKSGIKLIFTHTDNSTDAAFHIDSYYDILDNSWKDDEVDKDFHKKLLLSKSSCFTAYLFLLYEDVLGESQSGIRYLDNINICSEKNIIQQGYKPIAVTMFVTCGNKGYFLKTVYDQKYSTYSLGTLLLWLSLKELIDTYHIRYYDFQKGSENYKYWFGNIQKSRYKYLIYNVKSFKTRFYLYLKSIKKYISLIGKYMGRTD